jgi:hypothetical protein
MVKKKRETINPEPGTLNLLTQTVDNHVRLPDVVATFAAKYKPRYF